MYCYNCGKEYDELDRQCCCCGATHNEILNENKHYGIFTQIIRYFKLNTNVAFIASLLTFCVSLIVTILFVIFVVVASSYISLNNDKYKEDLESWIPDTRDNYYHPEGYVKQGWYHDDLLNDTVIWYYFPAPYANGTNLVGLFGDSIKSDKQKSSQSFSFPKSNDMFLSIFTIDSYTVGNYKYNVNSYVNKILDLPYVAYKSKSIGFNWQNAVFIKANYKLNNSWLSMIFGCNLISFSLLIVSIINLRKNKLPVWHILN